MPPPGYDPTNPTAYRRTLEREYAQGNRMGQTQGQSQGGQSGEPARRGRRRVADTGGRTDGRRRGRRRGGMVDRMRRQKRRMSGEKGQGTVAMKAEKRKVRVDHVISVRQLAHEMGFKAPEVIRALIDMGQMATITDMLDIETAALVANEFGYEVENVGFQEETILQHIPEEEEEGSLQGRPPVVTIMGHVDHGKTTLLDSIRESRVAQGEAGGITQHIGAYQVEWNDQKITFIDTPGHAAFTEMRARGANITDLVVLAVAQDDGVQAQTKEAISHAKAAGVPIVVAINKMDRPSANPDPIKQQLSDNGLVPEDWGGDILMVPVSALKKQGLEELLEAILLQTEILELQANPDRPAEGVVVEAKVERGRGAVATVLVQKGTLKPGNSIVLGATYGKVRSMHDFTGKKLKLAGPSTPVEVFGLNDLPETGDVVTAVKNDKDARTLAGHRHDAKRQAELAESAADETAPAGKGTRSS